jgi:hypothetical protein
MQAKRVNISLINGALSPSHTTGVSLAVCPIEQDVSSAPLPCYYLWRWRTDCNCPGASMVKGQMSFILYGDATMTVTSATSNCSASGTPANAKTYWEQAVAGQVPDTFGRKQIEAMASSQQDSFEVVGDALVNMAATLVDCN